jgi:hypothetical protein
VRCFPLSVCSLAALLALGGWNAGAADTKEARSGEPAPDVLRERAELSGQVELHEVDRPLSELLDALGTQTGVPLLLAADLKAQRVTLHARERPLAVVLQQIAACLGGRWTAAGAGYRLGYTSETHQLRNLYWRQRAQQARLVETARLKRFRAAIHLALQALARPEGGASGNPRGAVNPGFARNADLVGLLGFLSEEDLISLVRAGDRAWKVRARTGELITHTSRLPACSVPLARLPEEARGHVARSLRSRGGEGILSRYGSLAEDGDAVLHFSNQVGDGITLSISSGGAPGWVPDFPLLLGVDRRGNELNAGLTPAEAAAFTGYQAERAHGLALRTLPGELRGTVNPQGAPITLGPTGAGRTSFTRALRLLHEATGRTVIADSFLRSSSLSAPPRPMRLREWLTGLCQAAGRDGRVEPDCVSLRSTTWPEDETLEIERPLLLSWLANKRAQGALPAEDWLALGRLAPLQLLMLADGGEGDAVAREDLSEEALDALRGYDVLQLYHGLSPALQAQARRRPLRFRDLSPPQQRAAHLWAMAREGPAVTLPGLAAGFRLAVQTFPARAGERETPPPEADAVSCRVQVLLGEGLEHTAELRRPVGSRDHSAPDAPPKAKPADLRGG